MPERLLACVDIGATKLVVSLAPWPVDEVGAPPPLRWRQRAATVHSGSPQALANQVLQLLQAACEQAGVGWAALAAVGVSSCGPFVRVNGQLELAAPNLCGGLAGPERELPNEWRSLPLQAPLAAALGAGTQLRIANDCVAALAAERRWGALQGLDHCAYVTWSTGIGMGLCADGQLLQGKGGNAGHGGHMFVSDQDPAALCGCGNRGDVEALVAGNAIARRFGGPAGAVDAQGLLRAARQGEAAAVAAVDELCRVLGRALYNSVVLLDLERIALGGSVFWNHRDYLLPRLQRQVSGRLPALTDGVKLVAAGLGERVGDYAALALVA